VALVEIADICAPDDQLLILDDLVHDHPAPAVGHRGDVLGEVGLG
jgi:hypothetical protein